MSGNPRRSTRARSIVEIFNNLDFEEESSTDAVAESIEHYKRGLGDLNKNSEFLTPKSCEEAAKMAKEAQKPWANSPLLMRANALHKILKELQKASEECPKLKSKLSIFVEYFDFYSDLFLQQEEEKKWMPCGVVFIIVSNWSSLFAAAAIVPAALITGCSIVVSAPETVIKFFMLLKEIFSKAGLPEDVFNVATEFGERCESALERKSKVFFCGSYLSAQSFYANTSVNSFSFFCPSNTTAFILESADIGSAVNKIVSETWDKNSSFAVSNVVVQESVYGEFFDLLEDKMERFMIENRNTSKFEDDTVAEKIEATISKALKAGASVREFKSCGKWSPTVVVDYQSQEVDQDAPILKVLLCRTAKEGVALLNNCRYTLATSIWSELSSQALEISSALVTPNVWINCHGALDAGVPLQLSGFSGNCVLGGNDGILEFILPSSYDVNVQSENENTVPDNEIMAPDNYKETIRLDFSNRALKTWRRSRQLYMSRIANSLAAEKSLLRIIDYYAHSGSVISFLDRNCKEEFVTIKEKIPVGPILLFITTEIDKSSFFSLITPAIIMGNAVVVVLAKRNPIIESMVESFVKILPKSLLHVYVGLKFGMCFAACPDIQAIWLYANTEIASEIFKELKKCAEKYLRQIWLVPQTVPLSQHLFQSKCLKNKVVWLPKIDSFP